MTIVLGAVGQLPWLAALGRDKPDVAVRAVLGFVHFRYDIRDPAAVRRNSGITEPFDPKQVIEFHDAPVGRVSGNENSEGTQDSEIKESSGEEVGWMS